MTKSTTKELEGTDRRRSKRTPILETFSVFVVIPKKGLHRLSVHDISEGGLQFDLDIEGESSHEFPATKGDSVDFRLYLNNSLYIPLEVEILRITTSEKGRKVGAEFKNKNSTPYKAFLSLLELLDSISNVLKIDI